MAGIERQVSGQELLHLVTFTVNSTVDPEGLCLELLVFEAVQRRARMNPVLEQLEKAGPIDQILKEVEKGQARRIIFFGLRHKGNKKKIELFQSLGVLPAGSSVLFIARSGKTAKTA